MLAECKTRVEGGRSDRRGGRRKEDEGRKREYVCDVCGGHYAEPGVVARQRLSAPTYSHHPRPTPKPPSEPPLLRLMAYYFFLLIIQHDEHASLLDNFHADFNSRHSDRPLSLSRSW